MGASAFIFSGPCGALFQSQANRKRIATNCKRMLKNANRVSQKSA